jgi:DNA-binding transcriptional LysR family regulator
MNLYHLRVFLKVAEYEHITRASEELVLSQPAVTKIIQSLEHEIGMELVERQGRRIVLTYAGRVLHSYARRLFALEREMEEALANLRDADAGEITLAANRTTGVYLLPSIVARFRRHYPHVHLHVTILNSHEIVEAILNWEVDFGLVEGDPALLPSELATEVFAYDELILVANPGHRWQGVETLEPEALRSGELVLREQGSGIREVIEHALLQHRVKVEPLLVLPDNEAIKQMVINGVGVSILSASAVQRELAVGDLVRIPIAGVDLRTQIILARRVDKHLSRAALAFCEMLRAMNESEQVV